MSSLLWFFFLYIYGTFLSAASGFFWGFFFGLCSTDSNREVILRFLRRTYFMGQCFKMSFMFVVFDTH